MARGDELDRRRNDHRVDKEAPGAKPLDALGQRLDTQRARQAVFDRDDVIIGGMDEKRQPAQLRRATRQRDRSHADPARVASVVRFSLAQPSAVTAVSALVIPRKPRRSSGPVRRSCQAPLETIGLPTLLPRRPCRIV